MSPYQITFEKLARSLGAVLYSSVTPKFFILKGTQPDVCVHRYHRYRYSEKKYGQTLTTTKICINCGLGIGEVFPPKRNPSDYILRHSEMGDIL